MPKPHYDDVRDIPLPTDVELLPHLQTMLEGAFRRQVWVMLLDEKSRPLPVLMPTDVPAEADPEDIEGFRDFVSCIALDFDRATVVLTFERPGPAAVTKGDRRWLRLLRAAAAGSGVPFRGPYLVLGETVHQVPPDEYVGEPWLESDQ
jgi:hypothetical protein